MRIQLLIITGLVVAVLAGAFALQNPNPVVITFLKWTFSGSLALILILAFAFGFLSSYLISSASAIRKKFQKKPEEASPPPKA